MRKVKNSNLIRSIFGIQMNNTTVNYCTEIDGATKFDAAKSKSGRKP